jgi:hypothetical protein
MDVSTSSNRNLTDLIFRISRLLGAEAPRAALLQQVADEIAERLGASHVEIRLQPGLGRRIEAGSEATNGPSFVVYNNPLTVDGASLGSFTVEIAQPVEEPAAALRTLESVAWMLASLAERTRLREQRLTLLRQAEEAQRALARHKLLQRAAGVVAERRSIPQPQAIVWIEGEAARLKRNVEAIAERIIEISAELPQAQVA